MSSSDSGEFSESSSDSGSENDGLQHANASTAGRRIASQVQLRGRRLQRQVNSVQSRGSEASDLHNRLAAIQLQYLPRSRELSTAPSSTSTPKSRTSSMAVSVLSRSTIASSLPSSTHSSYTAPSLCGSASTLKSSSSIRTSATDSGTRQHYRIEEDDYGVPTLSEEETEVRLECCFGFLRCPHTFSELEVWDRHCRTHYRGVLPQVASCPFPGCGWGRQAQAGLDIWQERLDHMEEEHEDQDYAYPRSRPTVALIDHLFRARLIDRMQYQELRRDGRLSEQPVLNTTNRREERRHRR